MSISLISQYPGKVAPVSAAYPYGEPRNITVPSDGTGTPWEAAIVKDTEGFKQALLKHAGIVPSGTPDAANASEYLRAVVALASGRAVLCDDTGTASTYVVDPKTDRHGTANLFEGLIIEFVAANQSVGASTINYNGLGVKDIKTNDGGTPGNNIVGLTRLRYDGTDFIVVPLIYSSTWGIDTRDQPFTNGASVDGWETLSGTAGGTVIFNFAGALGNLTKRILVGDSVVLDGGAGAAQPRTVNSVSYAAGVTTISYSATAASDYTECYLYSYRADDAKDLVPLDQMEDLTAVRTTNARAQVGSTISGTGNQSTDHIVVINTANYPGIKYAWLKVLATGGTNESIRVFKNGGANGDSWDYKLDVNGYTEIVPVEIDANGIFRVYWTQFSTNNVRCYLVAWQKGH